jgi:hypothetical protein
LTTTAPDATEPVPPETERRTVMYSSYIGQELASTRINDLLARAEASRLAAAARQARPRRQRTSIPAIQRLLSLRPLTGRPAT